MRLTLTTKTFLAFVGFIALLFIIPAQIVAIDISNILTSVTVIFAILGGFFLATTLNNYSSIQGLIASETAGLISLCSFVKKIDPSLDEELRDAVDKYLIAQFDYELHDYMDNTWKEFNEILKVTDRIKKINPSIFGKVPVYATDIFAGFMAVRGNLLENRQAITLVSRRIMDPLNWVILIILAVINTIILYSIRDYSLTSSVLTVVLSTATVLILLLLNEIDSDRFAEEKLAFGIYERVFKEIGKMPYYPENSIKEGRVKPPEKEYRIGKYFNFPKSFEKTIEIVKAR